MRKRLSRGMILGVVGLMSMALGTAHAAVAVNIDNAAGSTVYSLPELPSGVDYPADLTTVITGTANFDSGDGSVLYEWSVDGQDGPIVIFSGQSPSDCPTAGLCNWSFRVRFALAPGNYHLKVTASQPDPNNPEVAQTAIDTVDLQVV